MNCILLLVIFLLVVYNATASLEALKARAGASKKPQPVVVLVTGSSTGIGKSTSLEFAADPKFKVWATMRSISSWTEPVKNNLVVAEMDVTSDQSVQELVDRIIAEDGRT